MKADAPGRPVHGADPNSNPNPNPNWRLMPPDVQSTELTPVIDKAKCSAAMDVLKHAEKEIHGALTLTPALNPALPPSPTALPYCPNLMRCRKRCRN